MGINNIDPKDRDKLYPILYTIDIIQYGYPDGLIPKKVIRDHLALRSESSRFRWVLGEKYGLWEEHGHKLKLCQKNTINTEFQKLGSPKNTINTEISENKPENTEILPGTEIANQLYINNRFSNEGSGTETETFVKKFISCPELIERKVKIKEETLRQRVQEWFKKYPPDYIEEKFWAFREYLSDKKTKCKRPMSIFTNFLTPKYERQKKFTAKIHKKETVQPVHEETKHSLLNLMDEDL